SRARRGVRRADIPDDGDGRVVARSPARLPQLPPGAPLRGADVRACAVGTGQAQGGGIVIRDYTLACLSEVVSPLTHAAGSAGNQSIVFREPVVTPKGVAHVPAISGNALRHRAIREPGARWLIEEYGLRGTLSLATLNWLFHGGNLTEGGGR